jgi:hypothetical protein
MWHPQFRTFQHIPSPIRPPKRPRETEPAVQIRRAIDGRPPSKRRRGAQRTSETVSASVADPDWQLAVEARKRRRPETGDRRQKPQPVEIKVEPVENPDPVRPPHQPNPDFRPIRQEDCKVEPGYTRSLQVLEPFIQYGGDREPAQAPQEAFCPTCHQAVPPAMMVEPRHEDPPMALFQFSPIPPRSHSGVQDGYREEEPEDVLVYFEGLEYDDDVWSLEPISIFDARMEDTSPEEETKEVKGWGSHLRRAAVDDSGLMTPVSEDSQPRYR